MRVNKDYLTFIIMGEEISIISDNETCYGRNTVAEIGKYYHHLGDEYPGIAAAIFAWQEHYGRDLTNEELRQAMIDNHLISEGI